MRARDRRRIETRTRELLALAGFPDLATNVAVVWARELDARVWGAAVGGWSWILYSEALMGAGDPGQVAETVAHEVAHLVAWRRHGYEIEDHGPEWSRVFRDMRALWAEEWD